MPKFEVQLVPPDIAAWLVGNTGIAGFTSRRGASAGPHVALLALSHGNELAGAIVLDRLLRAGLTPRRGTLTFGFVNLTAFERFDPKRPTASRFLDEDINRVWDESVLDGPRHSRELDRAREIRPLLDTVDVLLDLHSMLWPSDPLVLSGATAKGRALALGLGTPGLVVADHGHANGRRIIDYTRFSDPGTPFAASLVEAGQHWETATVDTALASAVGLLRHLDVIAPDAPLPPPTTPRPQRVAIVTTAVTAATANFAFVQAYRGGDVIPQRNTLIALDGHTEVRTPHDDCLLVMPSLRPSRGHTAVRLAKFV
ncbi:MAG: succinylglutamate desuccinylase/aspartoacylase family protein [Acetobacteraceae bacterium]|nr:succinylglutamate desuccinylase/aspartoacylase family protein [Acetobacteraceae bacterium]